MNLKQAKELVRGRLSDKRYEHTLNVKKMAVKLAKHYGADEEQAALAALLPDFRLREEHSLTEGMAEFVPVYKLLGKIPAIRNISNKIIVLEKE